MHQNKIRGHFGNGNKTERNNFELVDGLTPVDFDTIKIDHQTLKREIKTRQHLTSDRRCQASFCRNNGTLVSRPYYVPKLLIKDKKPMFRLSKPLRHNNDILNFQRLSKRSKSTSKLQKAPNFYRSSHTRLPFIVHSSISHRKHPKMPSLRSLSDPKMAEMLSKIISSP
jgi:hypothetical protein